MKKIVIIISCALILSGCADKSVASTGYMEIEHSTDMPEMPEVAKVEEAYSIFNYEENIGGANLSDFGGNYELIYYGMDTALCNLVSEEEYQKWIDSFSEENKSWDICLQADFIEFFHLDRETVDKVLGITYSEEQIDAFFSNEQDKIDEAFVNPYAVLINKKIYSPEWFATHTWSDYIEAGITESMLLECLSKWDDEFLIAPALQVAYQMKQQNFNIDLENYDSIIKYIDNLELYGIPDSIHRIVSDEEYEKYVSLFVNENVSPERSLSQFNIVNFVTDFEIGYMEFLEMTDSIFTDVEQQTIFSRNYEQIDKLFERQSY